MHIRNHGLEATEHDLLYGVPPRIAGLRVRLYPEDDNSLGPSLLKIYRQTVKKESASSEVKKAAVKGD